MLFSNLLFSTLLEPIKIQNQSFSKCKIEFDLIKTALYESFIPIDAFVFIIGTTKMSKSEINTIAHDVINIKNSILKNTNNLSKVFNLSDKINEQGVMKTALARRLSLMNKDESFILKELIQDHQSKILSCIDLFKNKGLSDPKIDKQYMKMVDRIYDAVYENLDINEILAREKQEFYREYKQLSQSEILRTKVALSLGSNIFYLPELVRIISRINLKEKEKFVRECANMIFDSVEKTFISMSSKSFIEQKYLAKEYVKNSIEIGPSNNAFEVRSMIVRGAKLSDEDIKYLGSKQNIENQRLIRGIENMNEQRWIIRYNKQIKEDFITYLLTNQPEDKKKILNHFH